MVHYLEKNKITLGGKMIKLWLHNAYTAWIHKTQTSRPVLYASVLGCSIIASIFLYPIFVKIFGPLFVLAGLPSFILEIPTDALLRSGAAQGILFGATLIFVHYIERRQQSH
ncbi:MAG: hypothetical protein WC289_03180 [Patescibacteria group bacterium]